MKAMILSAGYGARLRPLTNRIPKPLVRVGKHALIEHHIIKLAAAGFESIIINISYLGEKIKDFIGDGADYGIPIFYSNENEDALETGGGISYALPLLGDKPFLVISSDVYCDIVFNPEFCTEHSDLHMIMVDNPGHNSYGDFTSKEINLKKENKKRFTYSGVSYIDPKLFTYEKRSFPLADIIRNCIDKKTISSEIFNGPWFDVGTGRRLHAANKYAFTR